MSKHKDVCCLFDKRFDLFIHDIILKLEKACKLDHSECLKVILSNYNFDSINKLLLTSSINLLVICSKFSSNKSFDYLYNQNIDINSTDNMGMTSLLWAVRNKNVYIMNKLLNNKNLTLLKTNNLGENIFHIACISNNFNALNRITKLLPCESINYKNILGLTPLHIACRYNNEKCLQLLISKGANIYIKNYSDQTCLSYAYR
jgi:ankyrin repeat protein